MDSSGLRAATCVARDESGSVLVEYALVLALLSFAFMSGMYAIERTSKHTLDTLQTEFLDYGLRNGQ